MTAMAPKNARHRIAHSILGFGVGFTAHLELSLLSEDWSSKEATEEGRCDMHSSGSSCLSSDSSTRVYDSEET